MELADQISLQVSCKADGSGERLSKWQSYTVGTGSGDIPGCLFYFDRDESSQISAGPPRDAYCRLVRGLMAQQQELYQRAGSSGVAASCSATLLGKHDALLLQVYIHYISIKEKI